MKIRVIVAILIFIIILTFILMRTPTAQAPLPTVPDISEPTVQTTVEKTVQSLLSLSSQIFENNGAIPVKYTCDSGKKISPPLSISGVPAEAKSLVLIMEDPDIPQMVKNSLGIEVYDHWVLYNIPVETTEIEEGTSLGTSGLNSGGTRGYANPCPPANYEPREHRYIFTLYALDSSLDLKAGARKEDVLSAIAPHILEKTELIGRYSRR